MSDSSGTPRDAATPADIGMTFGPDAPSELIAMIEAYLSHFDAPIVQGQGGLIQSAERCACGKPLGGFLGTFTWGIVHGEGRCSSCGRPVRAYHTIRDEAGGELVRFPFMLLYRVEIKEAAAWTEPPRDFPSAPQPTFMRRGFADWPEIIDERGVQIWVAESSAATGPRIWVFTVDGEESYKKPQDGAAHLTIEQATALRDSLTSAIQFMSTRFEESADG